MMRYQLPALADRYELATCARPNRDPREWDAPRVDNKTKYISRPARSLHAAALCGACPLISICAEDALTDRPIGVIRAGVPVTKSRPARWQMRVWTAVAAGKDLAAAYAEHASNDHWDPPKAHEWLSASPATVEALALPIESLAWLEAHGLLGCLSSTDGGETGGDQ